jgi:hypothetical protein
MEASKQLCSVCGKPFCGKLKTVGRGIRDLDFRCSCVEISDSGQVLFTSPGESSKKKKKKKKTTKKKKKHLRSARNGDTPDKLQRSLSASDATKTVVFPERQLNLPELCSVCGKPFCGKLKTVGRGIRDLDFRCSCFEISDSGQVFFTSPGKSSKKKKKKKRKKKTTKKKKHLSSTRNGDTTDKPQRSLSASDATKTVIFPERQLNLPELTSNESLSVQIEILRLTGQTTVNLVEKLLAMVTKLTAEVTQLRSDNAVLQVQICELEDLLFTKSCHMEAAAGTSSYQPGVMSYKDAIASIQHQQVRNVNTSKISSNLISTNQKSKTVNAIAEVPAAKKCSSLILVCHLATQGRIKLFGAPRQ